MARRKRPEPISIEELEENPCAQGLEAALTFGSQAVHVGSVLPDKASRTPAVLTRDGLSPDVLSPDVMSGDLPSPALERVDSNDAASAVSSGDVLSPDGLSAPVWPCRKVPAFASSTAVVPAESRETGPNRTGDVLSVDKTSGDVISPDKTSGDGLPSALPHSAVTVGRRYRIHRCVMAEDGHSRTEEDCYQILWKAGDKSSTDDAVRITQMSQSQLAQALRLAERNIPAVLARLTEKLAIEELSGYSRQSRTARVWKVYSSRMILERRRAAGLEWVIRDKGVRFVAPSGDVLSGDDLPWRP